MVEAFFGEELINERLKDLLIVLVVHLASIKILSKNDAKRIPRKLRGVHILPCPHRVNIFIDNIEGTALVCLIKLICLAPPYRSEPQPFQNDCVKPGKQEVKPGPFDWLFVRSLLRQHCFEGALQGCFYSIRRLEDHLIRLAYQGGGNLWIEFHGQEDSEVDIRGQPE